MNFTAYIMLSYTQISTQSDMDQLLDSVAGFHDSLTKEIHLVNRGSVRPDGDMIMEHRYDSQILLQSQVEPGAIELLFINVLKIQLAEAGEYWSASGTVEYLGSPNEKRSVAMKFDSGLNIVAEELWYCRRKDWLGRRAFLTSEVPAGGAVPAHSIQEDWRQCSSCKDAWQERSEVEFAYCPTCERLTELRDRD